MHAHHGFAPIWGGWLGWLVPLLMIGLIAAVAVLLVYSFRRRPQRTIEDDPLRRAARRYANGELERVEFERIRNDLVGGSSEDALQNAALRLARGDIGLAEFDELRSRIVLPETVSGESEEAT